MATLGRFGILLLAILVNCTNAYAQYTGDISNATTTLTDTGAVNRSVVGRLADATQATDFCSGSQLTGGTDATSCLQAAATALCNRGRPGGTLLIPAGTYLVGGTVTFACSGIEISGAGIGQTGIGGAALTGTVIVAPDSGGSAAVFKAQTSATGFSYGFRIHDLSIKNNGSSGRTGPFIEIDSFQQAFVDHVYFYAPCNAIKINGGFQIYVENSIAENFSGGCKIITLTGNTSNTTDEVYFQNVKINAGGPNDSCRSITDRVQSVVWKTTQCETQDHARSVSCPTMTSRLYCPGFFTFSDFETEAFPNPASTDNFNLIDITDMVDGFKMSDSWFRGQYDSVHFVNNLVSILPSRFPVGNLLVNITSSWFKFAGGDCLRINSTQTQIMGNQIYGCNFFNVGGAGLSLLSSRANVSSNQFCGGDWLGDVTWSMVGGSIQSGADYIIWTGNVFNTNTDGHTNGCTGTVNNASSGSHILISNNVGP